MRVALPASLGLHFGLVIAAWLVAQAPPAVDEMSAESVAVDIVSVESFVSASASAVPTEATETLVSAGAEAVPPAAAAAVADTVPARLEAAAPLPAEVLPQLSPLAAAPEVSSSAEVLTASLTEIVPAVSDFSPIADPAAAAVAVAIPAELVPPGEAVSGRLPARPIAAAPVKVALAEPVAPAAIEPLAETEPEIIPIPQPRIERLPVETRAESRPVDKPAETTTRVSTAGNGGRSEADSAARAAAGGKGKANDGGTAAVGKYPGMVQSRGTRAARYPARARGARGEVEVRFTVDAGGQVIKLALARSSGNADLDAAALAAVERAAPFPPSRMRRVDRHGRSPCRCCSRSSQRLFMFVKKADRWSP
ncbi:MAG: TonB family protein [Devosia sp.]|nr:TonB family protein [Devosia sp.]